MVGTRRIAVCAIALLLFLPGTAVAEVAPAAPVTTIRAPQVVAAGAVKTAVIGSDVDLVGASFSVLDESDDSVLTGTLTEASGDPAPWAHAAVADFSEVDDPGTYTVVVAAVESGPVVVEANPYPGILSSVLGIFDSNADGREASSLHAPSHLNDARSKVRNGPDKGRSIDMTGGWMDAGDQLKFTVTIAHAAILLQLAARNEPSSAARLNRIADVGIRFLRKAHPTDRIFVAQVGDTNADHNQGFRDPTYDDDSNNPLLNRRPSLVLTKSTGGADVAAASATALALAAKRASGKKRTTLVRAAKEWYAKAIALKGPWQNCCYQQDTVADDLAGAAVELWRVTSKGSYRDAALKWLKQVTANGDNGWRVAMDGYEMAGLPAAELCGVLGAPAPSSSSIRTPACRILKAGGGDAMFNADTNAFGRAGPVTWGTVRQNQSGSLVALLAGRAGLSGAHTASVRALGWFLGANPWGIRFQAGFGLEHPYHWAQVHDSGIPTGAIVGGPASREVIDENYPGPGITLGPYDTDDSVYRDVADDYVTNEVGLNYSANSVLLLALLSPS